MAYEKPSENPIVYTHKEFGAAFFDQALPNANERMFMICRAINYDFDNYNKNYRSPDVANKRRYMRNVFRFLDNPIRYIFWKIQPYLQSGKIRMLPFYWFTTFIGTWWIAGAELAENSKMIQIENVKQGFSEKEHKTEIFTYDRILTQNFNHSEGNATKGLASNLNVAPSPMYCRLDYHIRDQNFRKHFAHRERRGADLFTGKPLSK